MTSHQVQLFLLDVTLIVVLARGLGVLAGRVGQPPVVGEIIAGILLGPTLMDGRLSDALFPAEVRSSLTGVADIGLALFMFAVGLEADAGALRGRGRLAVGAVVGANAVPFALGVGLGFYLLRTHPVRGASPTAFVVFVALTVSVTAFPVLARIIESRGLFATTLGGLALATAAMVDVVAWAELAVVQALIGGGAALWRTALFVLYGAGLFLIVRPLLHRLMRAEWSRRVPTAGTFPVVMAGALLSGAATEAMGMHFILGSFLFGMAMPRTGSAASHADLSDGVGRLTSVLLPVYFVVAGLQIDLTSLSISSVWQFGAILLVAVAGKVGGTYLGLRTQGMPSRPSMAIAALMNTRGLTGPIVVGVGLEMGLFDGELYSLMVVMMLITTLMTDPLLSLTFRGSVEVPGSVRGDGESTRRRVTARP
ncbi:hypothetical protein GCM10023191_098710 [Actinoallomurus oryzae]|uniref:Cation/H+ exchanger transmembrane domain-containing protein n=1 Tax=Actinoallomurus oryzae TaxID=502180 RepID=A0ABP8R8A2_9ACTN